MKKIIINADDYGLSQLFNKGIAELTKKGIITSVSVMIKQNNIVPNDLLKFKKISIGLHLELEDNSALDELEKQIDLFCKKFGKMPSHLDGHNHCHIKEINIKNIATVAKKYDLPVRSRFEEDRQFFIKEGIKTPEKFISWHPKRTEKLIEALKNVQENIIELVCHPGYHDEHCDIQYNMHRKEELSFLEADIFRQCIKKFKLVSYDEF